MRVFLDARDLIDTIERSKPLPFADLARAIADGGHHLVLTFPLVLEIAAPLISSNARSLMSTLTTLESISPEYLHVVKVMELELLQAVASFRAGAPYRPINPFVPRFDYTVHPEGNPPTAHQLSYSVPETIFDLWRSAPSLLGRDSRFVGRYRGLIAADRALTRAPKQDEFFSVALKRNLALHDVERTGVSAARLAKWIQADSRRCPSTRLGYETFHQVRANRGDNLDDGDLSDFAHVEVLPYVDLMTLDRRMTNYVQQAVRRYGSELGARLVKDVAELVDRL